MNRVMACALAWLAWSALGALAGCGGGQSRSYHHHIDKFDKTDTGTIDVATNPPNANVYAKAEYDFHGEARFEGRTISTDKGDFTFPLEDWTLIGTAPVQQYPILASAQGSDRKIASSIRVQFRLKRLSLRIEKEGYETINVDNLGLRPGGTKLTFDLKPLPGASAATPPAE